MTIDEKGILVVISGPSGAGKSTVISELLKLRDDLCFSVSVTTREMRSKEEHGVDYFFISKERFEDMVNNGELLEHASYVGNMYGTPRAYVEEKLKEGISVVLDIEVVGSRQIKSNYEEAVSIFVLPPNAAELERRLRCRKTDSETKIIERLIQAKVECLEAHRYDYVVINDSPGVAASKIDAIITAEKCKAKNYELLTEVYFNDVVSPNG
ncbi:MAG: guanylate kinase [Ruminococcaceae bacterium]|nr:guanylate kinase [Oscillospiraceae bacterium]